MNAITTLTACIPTADTSLYDSFGLDLIAVQNLDGEIISDHIEWIDGGDFPRDEYGDVDTDKLRDAADDLAYKHGLRILWGEDQADTGEYVQVNVERIA